MIRPNSRQDLDCSDESSLFVTHVSSNDVLMGRGAISDRNEGNIRFRELVRKYQNEYISTSRHKQKQDVAIKIMNDIKSRGGCFLQKIEDENECRRLKVPEGVSAWCYVTEDVALRKIKQALRGEQKDKETVNAEDAPAETARQTNNEVHLLDNSSSSERTLSIPPTQPHTSVNSIDSYMPITRTELSSFSGLPTSNLLGSASGPAIPSLPQRPQFSIDIQQFQSPLVTSRGIFENRMEYLSQSRRLNHAEVHVIDNSSSNERIRSTRTLEAYANSNNLDYNMPINRMVLSRLSELNPSNLLESASGAAVASIHQRQQFSIDPQQFHNTNLNSQSILQNRLDYLSQSPIMNRERTLLTQIEELQRSRFPLTDLDRMLVQHAGALSTTMGASGHGDHDTQRVALREGILQAIDRALEYQRNNSHVNHLLREQSIRQLSVLHTEAEARARLSLFNTEARAQHMALEAITSSNSVTQHATLSDTSLLRGLFNLAQFGNAERNPILGDVQTPNATTHSNLLAANIQENIRGPNVELRPKTKGKQEALEETKAPKRRSDSSLSSSSSGKRKKRRTSRSGKNSDH